MSRAYDVNDKLGDMLDKKIQITIRERSNFDDLHLATKLSFTVRIMSYECPAKFRSLTLDMTEQRIHLTMFSLSNLI